MGTSVENIVNVGFELDWLRVCHRGDYKAPFVVLSPNVNTRIVLRLKQVFSEHSLALRHNFGFDVKDV